MEEGKKEVYFSSTIGLSADLGAKYAILPGDPQRVEIIAKHLDDPKPLSVRREYTSWEGYVDGEKVLVISTGMGGPSTAICVECLHKIGVDTVIRLGTTGGMQPEVQAGDVVIPTAAIRMEGTTREYVHLEFPAVANFDVALALREGAKRRSQKAHLGVVQSKDSYFGQQEPLRMPIGRELRENYEAWIKAGCLASEMECAATFIVCQILRMRAGAVLNVIWNKETDPEGKVQKRDMTDSIKTVVEGLKVLIDKDRAEA